MSGRQGNTSMVSECRNSWSSTKSMVCRAYISFDKSSSPVSHTSPTWELPVDGWHRVWGNQ